MGQSQRFSTAGFYEVPEGVRKVYNFNYGWRFLKSDAVEAEAVDFDDSKWEAANLPHGLEFLPENASGGRNYQGIVWYRKKFSVPNPEARTMLYFEAVMGKCEVYVNGSKVAEHFGGYLPFAVDITDVVKVKGGNIVAVKADNSDDKNYPPGTKQRGLDFSYFGGIYRDSYIIQTSDVHISLPELSNTVGGGGVFVATTDVDGNKATLKVRTEITNHSNTNQEIIIKTTLEDTEKLPLKTITRKLKLRPGTSKQLEESIIAEDVHFWHPDDPYLHFVKTEVLIDGKVVDDMRTRFGIKLYVMRGRDGLYINKKPYTDKIMGTNRHQDHPYVGNALPNSGQWRDVKLLREGGSRAIRVAHYPCDPAFYDACDELGVFTTTANPGWHFFNKHNPLFEERMYEDTRNLVRAGRNYASILMWETALNETRSVPIKVNANMNKIAHEEYPFPGFYTVTDYHEAVKAGFDIYYNVVDSTVNTFKREYGDGPEVDSWQSQNAETRIKIEWGEKAMVNQAMLQAATLNGHYHLPKSRLGGTKWAGIDHYRGYHPNPFWGGLLNVHRLPKYMYYVYKSQYDADYIVPGIEIGPMLFVAHELTQISGSDIVVFSNCDEVRLTWMGEVVGTQKPSTEKKYANLPHPPFIFENVFNFSDMKSMWFDIPKVNMLVEGLIDGQVVVSETKDYAEQAAGLSLYVDDEGMQLLADGSDFVPVRAEIVDIAGTKKVLESEYVHFIVEGPAELVGGRMNNANPVKAEFGVATAYIRTTGVPGKITIKAYSKGLKPAEVEMVSINYWGSMLFDSAYTATSLKPNADKIILTEEKDSEIPVNVQELIRENERLKLLLTGREQEIMELRGQLGK